jgi:PAS domain S-box-containing protein
MKFAEDPFEITPEERQHFLITSEIANALSDIVWIAQLDGRINYYNRHWFKYTGMTLEQAQGAGWVSVVHPKDMRLCVERWTKALVTGEQYKNEFRLLRADGTYRWHLGQAMPVRNVHGKIIKWFGICRDIEDHVRAQRTIQDGYEKNKLKLLARIAELEGMHARLVRENLRLKELAPNKTSSLDTTIRN